MTNAPQFGDTPIPVGTDSSSWQGQLEKPWKVEIFPGRVIWCHTPAFLEMLAAGELPNELERFILYEPFDGDETKIVRGALTRKTDVELSVEQAERWKNKLRIAARAMDWPRVRLAGKPDYSKGYAALADLMPQEINEIAYVAIRRALPALPAIFPEPATGEPGSVADGGDLRPGESLPHDTEPDDRPDGERSIEPVLGLGV